MTDRAFVWHNGIEKLTKPRHTESKATPQFKAKFIHLYFSAWFRKPACPWSPENQNVVPTQNWRFAAQDCRQPAQPWSQTNSRDTSCFFGNQQSCPRHRLCAGSSEVLANSQPPLPNKVPLTVAPGGRPWGVGVSEKLCEVHKHLAEEMVTWSNTNAQACWHNSIWFGMVVSFRGTVVTDGIAVFREREAMYGQRGRAIHCSGQYINRHKSDNINEHWIMNYWF